MGIAGHPANGNCVRRSSIGTLVLTFVAEVVGVGNLAYQLVGNPGDIFELDASSGELRTARALLQVALLGKLPQQIRTLDRYEIVLQNPFFAIDGRSGASYHLFLLLYFITVTFSLMLF